MTSQVEEDKQHQQESVQPEEEKLSSSSEVEQVEQQLENQNQQQQQQQDEQNNQQQQQLSALRHNIEKKGEHSYYFAHSNTPTGPVWDGKEQPRRLLLSDPTTTTSDSILQQQQKPSSFSKKSSFTSSSFDYTKSNVTSYSFIDDGPIVKVYITDLYDIGTKCTCDDIVFDYTEQSFCITINNFKQIFPTTLPAEPDTTVTAATTDGDKECLPEEETTVQVQYTPLILSIIRLSGRISNATYKIKSNKIIVTLTKADDDNKDWYTINDKGKPDHEIV